MQLWSISSLGLILLIACLIAMITRRLGLPYTVGLVAAGFGLAFTPMNTGFALSPDMILKVFLPPLIFEGALQLDWRRFRRELPLTLTLAFPGMIVAACVIASGMHFVLGWSWLGSCFFGALIAATDPVSVIAVFRETHTDPRLSMVVESESLLNDGAAAVAFAVLLLIAAGARPGPAFIGLATLGTIGAGVAAGAVAGGAVLLIAGRTSDHLVEITLTTVAAYGSFLLAEHWGGSGVLASLTAGLMVGNIGRMGSISDDGRGHVLAFWDYVAFLANSIIFILIGLHAARQPATLFTWPAVAAIAFVLMGRAMSVYPLALAFDRSRLRLPMSHMNVLFWGGLRGALGLALALSVPTTVPEHRQIVTLAFAVVAFSVFVQGLTMPWLLSRVRRPIQGSAA